MSFSWSCYESRLNDPESGFGLRGYEIEDEPEPEYCIDCGEIAECDLDGVPHCAYCFARWLCGDHEILGEKEVRDEYLGNACDTNAVRRCA